MCFFLPATHIEHFITNSVVHIRYVTLSTLKPFNEKYSKKLHCSSYFSKYLKERKREKESSSKFNTRG